MKYSLTYILHSGLQAELLSAQNSSHRKLKSAEPTRDFLWEDMVVLKGTPAMKFDLLKKEDKDPANQTAYVKMSGTQIGNHQIATPHKSCFQKRQFIG